VTTLRLRGHDDNGHLDVAGLEALARTPHLTRLLDLDLGHNWFGDEGVFVVTRAACLKGLERLALDGIGMGNAGILALIETPALANLRELNVASNEISDAEVPALLSSPYLARLETFDLRGNDLLGQMVWDALRERFGDRVRL
jgi:hypothetical protein